MFHDAYQSYQAVNIGAQTAQASPVQLVLILMNGLYEELARARAHIEAGRYEQKAKSLDRCVSLLNGLSSSLDMEAGGELVEKLADLYEYCAQRLYHAGIVLQTEPIDEVVGVLDTLRQGWEGLLERETKSRAGVV